VEHSSSHARGWAGAPFLRAAAALSLVLAVGSSLSAVARAADPAFADSTSKYFRELRRRGLFRLAESYCLERLSHKNLPAGARADLTLELARTLAEHAEFVGDPEQTDLWTKSRSTLDDFLKQYPDNPRRTLIEVQAALLPATIGHSRRRQAEVEPYNAAVAREASQSLREAASALRAIEAQIAERLKKPPPRDASEGALRPFELRRLGANLRYTLGTSLLDQACLNSTGSPERAAFLLEAQKVLKTVNESKDDAELFWNSRAALVECSRLLGDPVRALKEIEALEKLSPPAEYADRLLAERIRALTDQKKFAAAAALLDEPDRPQTRIPGELAFLQIQLPIVRWQAEHPDPGERLPEPLQQALEQRALWIRQNIGGYWSGRSDRIIHEMQDVREFGPELAALAARAQGEFNSGRAAGAIELYGQAAAQAHRERRSDLAFQFGFTRASIEIKSKSWADAAADLLELVEQFPDHSKAAETHLLAAYALGKYYDEKPSRSRREEYTRVLEEHRSKYGKGPTGPEATWMLAGLNDRRGQMTVALELYKAIPADHKRAAAAQIAIARSYERILDRLRQLHERLDPWEEDAIKTLQQLLPAESSEPLEIHQADVAVRLARILLHCNPPRFEAADRLLVRAGAALREPSAPPETGKAKTAAGADEIRPVIRQLQVVSLAGQGRFQDAREMLHQLSATSPAELLRIIDRISPLESDDRQDPFHDLGELQLEAALRLNEHRSELAEADQRRLDECLARAYLATGQTRRGIEIYETLLTGNWRDKSLLKSYAELLVKCGNKDCLAKALTAWRKLEALYEAGSRDWFAVRFEVCRTLSLLQETAEACKLLQVTRLLYPKIEGDELQRKFAELEAACTKSKGEKPKK